MALSIKKPEVDQLVRELCSLTGESMTSAIEIALQERLDRLRGPDDYLQRIVDLQREFAALKVVDSRSPDEMLYDERGLPS